MLLQMLPKTVENNMQHAAILIIIEGLFQDFQRFSSSKLALKTVESCFVALNYYGNGSSGREATLAHFTWLGFN